MKQHRENQCIVLPFRPQNTDKFNGIGLALHFLIGNILVLHRNFKEMWFGWRVKSIFPESSTFQRYCRNTEENIDLQQVAHSQEIRVWIHGRFTCEYTVIDFFDVQLPDKSTQEPLHVSISICDDLLGFRRKFIRWMASVGWPMPKDQTQAALWPEKIDHDGLDSVGRCLEKMYLYSYRDEGTFDVSPFKKAVAISPNSFMAVDLYGWALYRNHQYKAAHDAFLASLAVNPAGAGAMSGLMWCGVHNKDLEEAMFWSGRKADVCGRDVEAARQAGRRRYEKINHK